MGKIKTIIGMLAIIAAAIIGFRLGMSDAFAYDRDAKDVVWGEVSVHAGILDDLPLEPELQMQVAKCCDEYDVPIDVVLGIIEIESTFRTDAVNRYGNCFSLMQVHQCNLGWLSDEIGISSVKDPYDNIRAGTYMIRKLYDKYGSWHCALVAYNWGEDNAESKFFNKGQYSSSYSWKVMSAADKWAEIIY